MKIHETRHPIYRNGCLGGKDGERGRKDIRRGGRGEGLGV